MNIFKISKFKMARNEEEMGRKGSFVLSERDKRLNKDLNCTKGSCCMGTMGP